MIALTVGMAYLTLYEALKSKGLRLWPDCVSLGFTLTLYEALKLKGLRMAGKLDPNQASAIRTM